MTEDAFIPVPETRLPCGIVVPAFEVGQFLCSAGDGAPVIAADLPPLTLTPFHAAIEDCQRRGWSLITETQWLAIAWDVCRLHANWHSRQYGNGKLKQGIRKGTTARPLSGMSQTHDPAEDRWKVLSNGHSICDFGGNAHSWVFDDVQGDLDGSGRAIDIDSPSVTTAPFPRLTAGMGYRPDDRRDIAGRSLARGGSFRSGKDAGAFALWFAPTVCAFLGIGFRATRPIQSRELPA